MKKRVIAALLSCTMAFLSVTPCLAAKSVDTLKNELSENQKKVEETKKEIQKKQKEQSEQLKQRDALDVEIAGIQDDIDQIQSVIDEKDAEIEKKNEEIRLIEEEIEKTDKKLKNRIKIIYESGSTSYLEVILKSNGISDLFTRLSVVDTILKHDNAIIENYENQVATIEEAKEVIENEKGELLEARKIIEDKQNLIEKKLAEKDKMLKELNSDINELKRQEKEEEAAAREIQAQINAALGTSAHKDIQYGGGKFILPLASYTRISSPFGYRTHPITGTYKLHTGIDYASPYGTSIYAAADGVVLTSGWINGYGYTVTINHGSGYVTLYAHCSKLLVSAGQKVTQGQTIAKVGSTGNSTGNHLHFEIKVNGKAQDPNKFY